MKTNRMLYLLAILIHKIRQAAASDEGNCPACTEMLVQDLSYICLMLTFPDGTPPYYECLDSKWGGFDARFYECQQARSDKGNKGECSTWSYIPPNMATATEIIDTEENESEGEQKNSLDCDCPCTSDQRKNPEKFACLQVVHTDENGDSWECIEKTMHKERCETWRRHNITNVKSCELWTFDNKLQTISRTTVVDTKYSTENKQSSQSDNDDYDCDCSSETTTERIEDTGCECKTKKSRKRIKRRKRKFNNATIITFDGFLISACISCIITARRLL